MSVDVSAEVIIQRPIEVVHGFMFDPRQDALWTGGVVAVKPLQSGLLATGHRVERTSRFLGRTFSYLIEVLKEEPGRRVEMLTQEPFEMRVTYDLTETDDGTRARIEARGGGSGFFKLAGPLLGKMVQRSIKKDLVALKRHLEASS